MKEEKETEKQNKKKLFTFWSYPAEEKKKKKKPAAKRTCRSEKLINNSLTHSILKSGEA